ncbi:MAG: bifunctional adenosylcobinamide kinase/adenosylcobinamide-phosphate guanylyltransferase [Acidimicrobiales bacterium]
MLGGPRSGKSAVAERLVTAAAAGTDRPVTYLAPAGVAPDDAVHPARIDIHRARRPASWLTVECRRPADRVTALAARPAGPVLVDSIGTWVTSHPDLTVDPTGLVAAQQARPAPTVVVAEEVGLAVHPPSALGRRYVDAVGRVNQAVASVADRALLVVAGRILELGPPPAGSEPVR